MAVVVWVCSTLRERNSGSYELARARALTLLMSGRPVHRRDEQHAAKLQESEVEEVARFIKMVSKRW